MTDFGTIAVTARLSDPDPRFVQSWTRMTVGGLRKGDKVLEPVIEMPHHWAASCAARDFLAGCDCDTLLMIDDDMTFERDAAERLRSNKANQDFDILQALCCSRQPPHAPLVLFEEGENYRPLLNPHEESGTIEVGMTGLAFTLIRRSVIESVTDMLRPNELLFNWGYDGRGEDCTFCRRARKAGYRIGIDTTITPGHRFPVEVSWNLEQESPVYSTYPSPSFRRLLDERTNETQEE